MLLSGIKTLNIPQVSDDKWHRLAAASATIYPIQETKAPKRATIQEIKDFEKFKMMSTGIVRRIDPLGRVVIPKEIRKRYHFQDNDFVEMFVDSNGSLILKRYSPLSDMSLVTAPYADALFQNTGCPVVICDRDRIITVAGISNKFQNRHITALLDDLMEDQNIYVYEEGNNEKLFPIEESDRYALINVPIMRGCYYGSSGIDEFDNYVYGSLLLMDNGHNIKSGSPFIDLANTAVSYFCKQLLE